MEGEPPPLSRSSILRKKKIAEPLAHGKRDSCTIRLRGKVQMADRFRPVGTGSVPFLSQVCPDEQLFRRCLRAKVGWKLKYESALTNASFPPARSAFLCWSFSSPHRSGSAGHGSRITPDRSRVTSRRSLLTNRANSNRLLRD